MPGTIFPFATRPFQNPFRIEFYGSSAVRVRPNDVFKTLVRNLAERVFSSLLFLIAMIFQQFDDAPIAFSFPC